MIPHQKQVFSLILRLGNDLLWLIAESLEAKKHMTMQRMDASKQAICLLVIVFPNAPTSEADVFLSTTGNTATRCHDFMPPRTT